MIDRSRELKDILWILAVCGAVAIGFRLWFGLGATTHLSDAVPWGLWKILNMVAGVALATGGFTVGFLVYVLKLEQFRPLVKPAILIAFLGYGSSCFALMLDIGLPHRIWHPIVMWNEHSFLFEVAWCVMLYFTVTIIELSPTILDRLEVPHFIPRIGHFLHRIAFGVVVVGISLSSLHHSSLGSLFLVTPQRLHPLWFTPRLPLLFIVSAMGGGLMVVVLGKLLYERLHRPTAPMGKGVCSSSDLRCLAAGQGSSWQDPSFRMLQRLATIATGILSVYLALRVVDLFATGAVHHLLAPTWESWCYLGALITIAVVPITIMLVPAGRRSASGLFLAAFSAAVGLVWNRLNVGIFGYFRDAGTVYFPSLIEWLVSLGVVAAAGLVFLFVSENFAVFDEDWEERRREHVRFLVSFDKFSGVWYQALSSGLRRVTLIAVFALPLAWVFLYPPYSGRHNPGPRPVKPPVAQDAQRAVLVIDGNRQSLAATFHHAEHQKRLGGDRGCTRCHHLSVPHDHSTPCSRCHKDMEEPTRIFKHTAHFEAVAEQKQLSGIIPENYACAVCHAAGRPRTGSSASPCADCHDQNMGSTHELEAAHALSRAPGYRQAMHATCLRCHREQQDQVKRPNLAHCVTCHPSRNGISSEKQTLTAWLP